MSKHNYDGREELRGNVEEPILPDESPDQAEDTCGCLWLIELVMGLSGDGTLYPTGPDRENASPKQPKGDV